MPEKTPMKKTALAPPADINCQQSLHLALTYGYKEKYLGGSLTTYQFNKTADVGSELENVTFPAWAFDQVYNTGHESSLVEQA